LKTKIILGSQSPRRLEILEDAGFEVEIVKPKIAENIPSNMPIEQIPEYLSKLKMYDIYSFLGADEDFIITADTLLVFENKLVGKPKNKEHAIKILTHLNNKTHDVVTGVTIRKNKKQISFSEKTKVYFKNLTKEEILNFIEKNEVMDKAGAYNIQEYIGVEKFEGDFFNVVGLPLKKIKSNIENWESLV
jgi:septum formation protein